MGNTKSFVPFDETKTKVKSKLKFTRRRRRKQSYSHSLKSELLVSGYINMYPLPELQTSYSLQHAIETVIFSYYHQSYAKYLCIDGIGNSKHQVNGIIKHCTSWGDIIQIKYESGTPFFAVVGNYHELHPCFISDSRARYMEIPYEICRKLDNAWQYYSGLMHHHDMIHYGIDQWNFIIKHDDNYVYNQFKGEFQRHYEPIKLSFHDDSLQSFTVGLDQKHETIFYNHRWKYTAKDIDDYYRIRNQKLIRIEILHNKNAAHVDMCGKNITFPSGQWEYDYYLKDDVMNECFIGPLDEQKAMLRMMRALYDEDVFQQSYKQETDANGYGVYLVISFIAKANAYAELSEMASISRSASFDDDLEVSRWDLELEDEGKCRTVTPAKLKKIIMKCPTRTHLYEWKLFYSTEYDGLSINTMYDNLSGVQESLLIVQDDRGKVFGAFVDCEWVKPLAMKKSNKGKIPFRGSIDCFVWNYNSDRQLSVYHASGESPYYFRNDLHGVTIGAGGRCAIYFDYNFMFGRSVDCDTYNSPCLASAEQFKIVKVEIWGPDYYT